MCLFPPGVGVSEASNADTWLEDLSCYSLRELPEWRGASKSGLDAVQLGLNYMG